MIWAKIRTKKELFKQKMNVKEQIVNSLDILANKKRISVSVFSQS